MQALMSLSIVLTGKSLAANTAYERALVSVSAQMRPEVVCPGKALRT
jgi:hypothetical protein